MGLVHQTFDHSRSTSLARMSEHNCRLREPPPDRLERQESVFSQITKQLGRCNIDLFANYQNIKLDLFYSWRPDPKSQAVDALVQPWGDHNPYLFPPFSLTGRCLQKLKQEGVQLPSWWHLFGHNNNGTL